MIEVMLAIFVVVVGVLGVAPLLTAGGFQARQATIADRKSRVARAAVADFRVRGMANPRSWSAIGDAIRTAPQAVCIDPRGVTRGMANTFPGGSFAAPVPRINLRADPTGANATVMNQAMADEVFTSHDDLSIEFPADDLVPSQQIYATNGGAPVRRMAERRFSWMATLSPVYGAPHGTNPSSSNPTFFGDLNTDLYRLSVVVFHNRTFDAQSEQVTTVTFRGGGLGGGDVRISPPLNDPDNETSEGNWLFLGRNTGYGGQRQMHGWYKIIAVSNDIQNNSRELTLEGRDWTPDPNLPTQAVWVKGVVGVYERTMRLEGPSEWSFVP